MSYLLRLRGLAALVLISVLGLGTAHAACDEERAAWQASFDAVVKNEAVRLQACGDLRLCKKDERQARRACLNDVGAARFACMQECRATLSGRAKRQCKQECRQGARLAKADCRRDQFAGFVECRSDGGECLAARTDAIMFVANLALASEAYYSCVRKNAGAAETETEREEAEDAAAAEG